MKKKISMFNALNYIVMSFIIFITLYPFLWLMATSLSSGAAVAAGKVAFYPKGFNTESYKLLFKQVQFWQSYQNTVFYTVFGTIISLIMTILCAYPLSKKYLSGNRLLIGFMVATMFVQGGMIPSYLVVISLGMRNSIWAILIPGAISTYNMIIMRTFFQSIPPSLEEAAMIDGLNHFGILRKIYLPLSKPIIATMTLFYAVDKWNAWFKPLLYLDKPKLFPVSLYLRNIVFGTQLALKDGQVSTGEMSNIYMTIKSTAIILVVIPILCIYPFIQRYLIKGMMLGSVKE